MQSQKVIVVVDDDLNRRNQIEAILTFIGEKFAGCGENESFQYIEKTENILAVILCNPTSSDVVNLIKQAPQLPFVLYSTNTSSPLLHYLNVIGELIAPLNYAQLTEVIHQSHQYHNKKPSRLENTSVTGKLTKSLVGVSEAMNEVRLHIQQVATTMANVLILGESGTGKEVVARNIHNLSERSKGPFVPINCGAIPAELLESELFGHEKGSFTGAISARKGRFELAEGGTLFLDEIGDMPQPMQVKLLRVLQERTFERVGGNKSIKADVRIIAATHQHLEKMIEEGNFREDLFYRLNVFPIETPSLRERKEDLAVLIPELVSRFEATQGKTVRFTEKAIESLMEHPWSGNVRELTNLIERMIVMYGDQTVNVSQLPLKYQHIEVDEFHPEYPEELQERDAINELFCQFGDENTDVEITQQLDVEDNFPSAAMVPINVLPDNGINLKEFLADLEVSLIEQALLKNDWVVARAAELLEMGRTTLVEKIRKYDIQKKES